MKQSATQILRIPALILTLFFLVMGYLNLTQNRPADPPAATSAAVAPTATPTDTSTPAPTDTRAPSSTPLPTGTPRPSATATTTTAPSATATVQPADDTATPATEKPIPTETASPVATDTPSGPPTDTPTPTLTPTPVPRTVLADDVPDYTQAIPHLWFTRPFTDEFFTWGSWYYPYGTNNNGEYLWHRGNDIQNEEGTPIVAAGDGLVVFAGPDDTRAIGPSTNFYGQAVVIQHSNGITTPTRPDETRPVFTLYGHVSQVLVQEGETVVAGRPIALEGQAGVALGPHLHLEVRLGENSYLATQNPDLWVRPDPGYGIIAGRVVDADGFYVPQQLMTLHVAATPDKFWRQTWTYPDHRYTLDPGLGETFVFADVQAGDYIIKTHFDGRNYSLPVTVQDGELSFVLIEGQPAPTPPTVTPEAEETAVSPEAAAPEPTATP